MLVRTFLNVVAFGVYVVFVAYLHISKVNVKKMTTQTARRKKSIRLTTDEMKTLKRYRKSFHTEVDCAEEIGIKRETLNRVFIFESGSPKTVELIRSAIRKETANVIDAGQ